jgi:hypothetical protein
MNIELESKPVDGFIKLYEDLERSINQPNNPYKQSFSVDFLELLHTDMNFADIVNQAYRNREVLDATRECSPVTSSYAGHLALYSVHSRIFDKPGYLKSHNTVGSWKKDIRDAVIKEDCGLDKGNFTFDIPLRDAMSNIPSRYFPSKLIAAQLALRKKKPLVGVDVGTSRMHGPKKLASGAAFDIPDITGLDPSDLKVLADSASEYEMIIGVDQWPIDERDYFTSHWAMACSIPPHEMSKRRIKEYLALDRLRLDNVHMHLGKIGTKYFLDEQPQIINKVDIAFMIASAYQMSQEKFSRALEQTSEFMADGGVIQVQDHIILDKDGRIEPIDNWQNAKSYPFRTYIYDTAYADAGWVEVFRWTNGRCVKGKVSSKEGLEAFGRLAD